MKIKRFFAADMRQAIAMVREEQGPDAVILSNRRVDGGVEIISATEYDDVAMRQDGQSREVDQLQYETHAADMRAARQEPVARPVADNRSSVEWSQDPAITAMQNEIRSLRFLMENQLSTLAWSDLARSNPVTASLLQRLSDLGIKPEISRDIVTRVESTADIEHGWRQVMGLLAHSIDVTDDDILSAGGVVAVVGPTGVGKTTTVAKLAARYALRHGKRHVALISTDHYRIGAHDQLVTYGRILGVPVYVASSQEELAQHLRDLADKRLVLIDTAGMSQRDMRLNEQFTALHECSPLIRSYLVMSANTQGTVMSEVVSAFKRVELSGCILTKVDEAVSLGGSISAVIEGGLPVAYLADGQRVPEDLHPARSYTLVSKAVGLMKQFETEHGSSSLNHGDVDGMAAHAHV